MPHAYRTVRGRTREMRAGGRKGDAEQSATLRRRAVDKSRFGCALVARIEDGTAAVLATHCEQVLAGVMCQRPRRTAERVPRGAR